MRFLSIAVVFGAGVLAGCMAASIPVPAQTPAPGAAPSRFRVGTPLLIDRTDLRLGMSVHYDRIPNGTELAELGQLTGLAHVVLSLPSWPDDYAPLQALDRLPHDADLVVVLPGYPPSRGAVDVWDYVQSPLRVIVVADGPPPNVHVVHDLNAMRSLERVIAHLEYPSRSGFERLQRPLSFRKVVD
jgi:hypothetical protein